MICNDPQDWLRLLNIGLSCVALGLLLNIWKTFMSLSRSERARVFGEAFFVVGIMYASIETIALDTPGVGVRTIINTVLLVWYIYAVIVSFEDHKHLRRYCEHSKRREEAGRD